MKMLIAALFVAIVAVAVRAATVLPTSNVIGDTSATATTLVYRDTVGSTALSQLVLTPNTTNTLVTLVPASTGALVTVQLFTAGVLGSAYGVCEASGIAPGAWVWPSTSSTSQARACN